MYSIIPGKHSKSSLSHSFKSKVLFLSDSFSCYLTLVLMSGSPGQNSRHLLIINVVGKTLLINKVHSEAMNRWHNDLSTFL